MPTPLARFKRRLVRRDWGLIALGLVLGVLVLLTGRLARDDASTTATDAAVKAAVQEVEREAYRQDIDAWHGRLKGCQRGKKDRAASAYAFRLIAAGQRAQSDYLKLILVAQSVMQDVKRAAVVNQRRQERSSNRLKKKVIKSLMSRTGANLDCRDEYPKPPAPDGVDPLP